MQIVIDISENTYNLIARGEESRDFVYKSDLMRAILEGTPLPKGHGKLIDADIISFADINFFSIGDYRKMVRKLIDAPTIIEADKAESEDKE